MEPLLYDHPMHSPRYATSRVAALALAITIACTQFSGLSYAKADTPVAPPRLTTNYEATSGDVAHSDTGYSTPIGSGKSLWVTGDTVFENGGFGFGTFAYIGPTFSTNSLSSLGAAGAAPKTIPNAEKPSPLLPLPQGLRDSGNHDCTGETAICLSRGHREW